MRTGVLLLVLAIALVAARSPAADDPAQLQGVVTMMRSLELGNYMFVRTVKRRDWRYDRHSPGFGKDSPPARLREAGRSRQDGSRHACIDSRHYLNTRRLKRLCVR